MGTRADFYVGRGKNAEWLGSIAWDGYPSGIIPHGENVKQHPIIGPMRETVEWPAGGHLFDATTDEDFKSRLARFFQHREDVTLPEDGWPWPWTNSGTTDYAYALDGGKVWASSFGSPWFDPINQPDDEEELKGARAVFPEFSKDRMAPVGSTKSGIGLITIPRAP